MTADLHNLSVMIGRLQNSDEASQRQRAELFKQTGELRADVSDLRSEVRATNGKLDTVIDKMSGVIGLVGKHERLVQQGQGASKLAKILYACLPAGGIVGLLELLKHIPLR